jgi:site-specific DNA recombinase
MATTSCRRRRAREAGERRIKPDDAEVVRRIFRAYAAGQSARTIARDLNAEQIPGPGGRPWIDTTIRGQADRGTGLLNNTLYIGRLSWNRCSYVKDPRTGRRVARLNDRTQWEEVAVPALRITTSPWRCHHPAAPARPARAAHRRTDPPSS